MTILESRLLAALSENEDRCESVIGSLRLKIMQIEGIMKHKDEVIARLSEENELFKSKLVSIEELIPNESQSNQNNVIVLANTTSAVHECNSELSSPTNLNSNLDTNDDKLMNTLRDICVAPKNHSDLIAPDHSKENQPHIISDRTRISPGKSTEINVDVSIAACTEDVLTPTVSETVEIPTPPTVFDLEEVSSTKSQRTDPHSRKKEIPCPFIVRRGWCIKGEHCDFSHLNLVNKLELRKSVKQKNAVFCPFMRKKGYCLKESRCDFSHKNLQKPQSPSFFGNRQQKNITSLRNRLEMRLKNIEHTQISYAPSFLRAPPQPMYQPFRTVYPSPLMETPVYPPQ